VIIVKNKFLLYITFIVTSFSSKLMMIIAV
jgi:hypothetical protein